MGSQGIACSKGAEKTDDKLLYTGQADKNIETEIESKQLSLAVRYHLYLRKQDFGNILWINVI